MHRLTSSFVLGYHGCDAGTATELLRGSDFRFSRNDYDWLGPGIYFWEANPRRALEYAAELKKLKRGPSIKTPATVGAVIDLGLCLDLTSSVGIQQVRESYTSLLELHKSTGWDLPENSMDLLRRNLDCAVIGLFHDVREEAGELAVDTVKGIFTEGQPIYPGSGFLEKTHTQICVRNPQNIKGVFRVPDRLLK